MTYLRARDQDCCYFWKLITYRENLEKSILPDIRARTTLPNHTVCLNTKQTANQFVYTKLYVGVHTIFEASADKVIPGCNERLNYAQKGNAQTEYSIHSPCANVLKIW